MVPILRIAHEVAARSQIFNLAAGAGGVGAFIRCAVLHVVRRAGDFAVAAALGGRADALQAVGGLLFSPFDAPLGCCRVRRAVRPPSGFGGNADGIRARVRGNVSVDVHRFGVIALYVGKLLPAVVDVFAGDADGCRLDRPDLLKLGNNSDVCCRLDKGIRVVMVDCQAAVRFFDQQALQTVPFVRDHRKHDQIARVEQRRAVRIRLGSVRRDRTVCAVCNRHLVLRVALHGHLHRDVLHPLLSRTRDNIQFRKVLFVVFCARQDHRSVDREGLLPRRIRIIGSRNRPIHIDKHPVSAAMSRLDPDLDLGEFLFQRLRFGNTQRQHSWLIPITTLLPHIHQIVPRSTEPKVLALVPAGVFDENVVVLAALVICGDRIIAILIRQQNGIIRRLLGFAVPHRERGLLLYPEPQITVISPAALQFLTGRKINGFRSLHIGGQVWCRDIGRSLDVFGFGVDIPAAICVILRGVYMGLRPVDDDDPRFRVRVLVFDPGNFTLLIHLRQLLLCVALRRTEVAAGFCGVCCVDPYGHRIAVIVRILACSLEIVRFVRIRAVSRKALVLPQLELHLRIHRGILQQKCPAPVDQAYHELLLFFVIWDLRPIRLIGQLYRRILRQLHREDQILIVRQQLIHIRLASIRTYHLHPVPPVDRHRCRGLVACVVCRHDGIFISCVIVAAVRRGKRIGRANCLLHIVDGHRLDAGGRLSRCRRVADGEGVRARLSLERFFIADILGGIDPAVLQHLQNRRFRVRFHDMAADIADQLVRFRVPAAGFVFAVLRRLRRDRVTRLTLHIPARPDVARLPVDPAEVVLPVAGVVDQLQFHRVDRPAVVLHVRQRQQLHVDTPVLVGDQDIIEVPEEGKLVVAVDGLRLNLQLYQLSMV